MSMNYIYSADVVMNYIFDRCTTECDQFCTADKNINSGGAWWRQSVNIGKGCFSIDRPLFEPLTCIWRLQMTDVWSQACWTGGYSCRTAGLTVGCLCLMNLQSVGFGVQSLETSFQVNLNGAYWSQQKTSITLSIRSIMIPQLTES